MMKFFINILIFSLLILPEAQAARGKAKAKGSDKNPMTLKVFVTGRNTDYPVYKAKVSFVAFSSTKKSETDNNGSVEMQFPAGDTVALSIEAEGYRPTSTKGYKLTKNRTIKVKMRQGGKNNPLPTPIPTPLPTNRPTNPPNKPTVFPTTIPGNPTFFPTTFPTNRPGTPSPRPTARPTIDEPPVSPPVISAHPQSRILQRGQSVTLSVTASGTGPLTYRWMMDNTQVGSGSTYTFRSQTISSVIQQFSIYCIVSNAGGSTHSNIAVIRVMPIMNNGSPVS